MFGVFALLLLSHQPIQPVVEGTASYYTVASSSPMTATGERLDDNALTCAMLEGEFGSYYLVVADNGKSVVVRLNDRGPYIKGRVIDLTEGAMRVLDPKAGMMEVKVYPLGRGAPEGRIPAGLPSP